MAVSIDVSYSRVSGIPLLLFLGLHLCPLSCVSTISCNHTEVCQFEFNKQLSLLSQECASVIICGTMIQRQDILEEANTWQE